MKASVILNAAAGLLQDEGLVRWTADELLTYLNQGRREVVRLMPDDFRSRRTVQLAAGAEQSVPDDCAAFMGVLRNMGADGSTPGKVARKAEARTLDLFDPLWRSKSGTAVKEWMQEGPLESTYLVNPPVSSVTAVHVEIALAPFPADLSESDGSENLGMSDRYEVPLLNWILYQAHAKETEEGSMGRAIGYWKAFRAELGVKT